MSKNKQMLSEKIIIVGSERATAGPVGLAQGVYGARGNLELVACDTHDGLWVFWFNADHEEDPLTTPDVPPGRWSSGLSFAAGARYVDAQIAQSTLGPDHLEVLALTGDGVLQSWFWSPGPGFVRRAADAAAGVAAFRLSHQEGTLTAAIERTDGSTAMLTSGPEGYPSRSWRAQEGAPKLTDTVADELLEAHGIRDVTPDTARAAHSTRGGGTTEVTWRGLDGRIRHLGIR